ncbi:MAG: lysophospholipid acyltransferase family protein [Planctomycetota bacterium]
MSRREPTRARKPRKPRNRKPRNRKPRNKVVDYLQYVALRSVVAAMQCWPVESNLAFAGWLGDAMYRFDKRHRDRALDNLRRSFPDMPEAQRAAMARRSMHMFFALFVEVLFTTRLTRLETVGQVVELSEVRQTIDLLLDEHRGVIMLTGHYGNWEILGYVLALLGFDTVSVARPLDNPYVNDWLLGVRERMGQKIVDKKGATTDVANALEHCGAVGFIADQNAGPKGMFVPFFGRLASTYKSIGLLAMRYRVPVVVGYARRATGKFKFTVGTSDVIYPEDWEQQDDPLRYITERYTRAIETFVEEDPGQYLWVHRRWKTRPKGEVAEA